ncbi:bcl2-associated agonist of cell death-like [Acipenser ruthenus]|uniref:bcl2-associated agonist of cell death-like n=1 Tax=Acipenser ruthenus TaxID=7906 RepID=UPI002741080A|nr:bcl2-associated agonist of cell death-like [Acipenser ruthenus]
MDKMFSLSESDSDLSDDDGVVDQSQHASGGGEEEEEGADGKRRTKSLTAPRPELEGRARVTSESQASDSERDDTLGPFRARSCSAPASLWAAQKYGRELRRMSDEFDSCLDKGIFKRVRSAGTARQMKISNSWWTFLWNRKRAAEQTAQGVLEGQ